MNGSLRWKLIVGLIFVFLAGAMTGVFFAAMHARHMFMEGHEPGVMATRMKQRLRFELKLTPEQEAKIFPMVDKMTLQLQQIRMETGRRVRQTFVDAHHEMEASLTDEQRKKLHEMQARPRAWHGRHGPHGPPE